MSQFGESARAKWLGIMNLSCQRDASRDLIAPRCVQAAIYASHISKVRGSLVSGPVKEAAIEGVVPYQG
jgi:hypothetical protein